MANRGQVPRLLRTVFAEVDLFRCGLVVQKNERGEEILSETAGLNANYIHRLLAGAPRAQSETDPKTLLYLVLRHATLLEYARAGLQILEERGLVTKLEMYERELVNITSETRTVFNLLDQRVAGVTGRRTLLEYLLQPRVSPTTRAEQIVDEYRNALLVLEPLPTAELERLFTETLDVCAYRLDAWTTSLATKRLQGMREVRPSGAYIGAYGWVEDLKPFPADERHDVPIDGEAGVSAFTYSGGYIYAPSMTHGAAAAVLRNAYMTRQGDHQSPYAVNLSSARVRAALWLLDTVREGQPLGASLGYLFERELHDEGLDRFIDRFRHKYPLVQGSTDDGGGPAESVAARDVVDGYALLQHFKKRLHWNDLAAPLPDERRNVDRVLARVDNALDGLADLLTAESVFQMVGGSIEGASATLDTMGKGAHPPEPEIANMARGGTSVTHRVALVLGGDPGGDPGGEPLWPVATPRSEAEPLLNVWVGNLLGNPSNVVCEVSFSNRDPRTVTLRDLELQPLDVLTLAREGESPAAPDSELERRVKYAAMQLAGLGAQQPLIQYDVAIELDRQTFPEMLEVARSINALLSGTRALHPRDLLVPEAASDVEAQGFDLLRGELQVRADAALAHLVTAIGALDSALPDDSRPAAVVDFDALRTALRAASLLGVAAAFPPLFATELVAIAQSVVRELRGRLDRAVAQTDPVSQVREVLGRDFVFLPRFTPAQRGELTQAVAQGPDLGPDPDDALSVWFAKAARVRKPLGSWRMVSLYATSVGRPLIAPRMIQLPFSAGAPWVGLPFGPSPTSRPKAGQVSLMLLGGRPPAAGEAWAGVLLDEWVELIPNATEDAGVVFHYDRPNAEAPQAVLVAVPPDATQPWSLELLLRIVEQTFEMAKTRGFDGEWKHATGDRESDHALYNNPWLPLILMADGDHDATIASNFPQCMQRGTTE